MSDLTGSHLGADEGTCWWFLDTPMTIEAGAAQTHGGRLIDCRAPAGFGPPLHVHRGEDEGLPVLEGRLALRCDGRSGTATGGSFVLLPPGVPHAFGVTGGHDCRLQSTSPARFEGFVAEPGRPAQSSTLPEPSLPDVAALAEAASKHDHELVGPPLAVGS